MYNLSRDDLDKDMSAFWERIQNREAQEKVQSVPVTLEVSSMTFAVERIPESPKPRELEI